MKNPEATRYVVKSNELNEKSGKLALTSQKLVCIFISLINTQRDNPDKRYIISFSDIFYLLDMDDRLSIKEQLTREVKKLNSNSFWLDEYTFTTWVSQVTFNENGTIEFCFPEKLHKHLFNLKQLFVKYRLGHILPMKSVYSIRLYELCKQWQKLEPYETATEKGMKKHWTPAKETIKKISVDKLRVMMGIESEKLKVYADFKRRALASSIKEINATCDIKIYIKEIKLKGSKLVTDFEIGIYNQYVKIDDFFAKIDDIKQVREFHRGVVDITNKHLNSTEFNAMYQSFINNLDKFPSHYTFENFLEKEFPEVKVRTMQNQGKRIEWQKNLFNQIIE
ncbi:putative Initiator Rep protein domain-containing protein [Azospirillaceae bacterium]